MTSFDRAVVIVNSLLAFASMCANAQAIRGSSPTWRSVHAAIAALAAVYAVAYAYLAVWPHAILTWSQTMRGVSLLAWPLVWIIPAVVQRRSNRQVRDIINKECPQ